MELIVAYLVGVVVLMGAFVIRTPDQDLRMVFLLGLFWPASLLFIVFISALWAVKWDFDVAEGAKLFGFRKPTNPEVTGFALTLFKSELQFWKKRK